MAKNGRQNGSSQYRSEFRGLALVAANHRLAREAPQSVKDKKQAFINGGGKKSKKQKRFPKRLVPSLTPNWFAAVRKGGQP